MQVRTVEESFEYNIRKAVRRFLEDFADKSEAVEALYDNEQAIQLAVYLFDRAEEYIDINEIVEEEAQK